jgi:hypothetical protein
LTLHILVQPIFKPWRFLFQKFSFGNTTREKAEALGFLFDDGCLMMDDG